MYNVPEIIRKNIFKLASLEVCPNIIGQLSVDLLVKPPTLKNSSIETVSLYEKEKNANFQNLKNKANILYRILNTIPGFSCQPIEGAMYAFPKIDIPQFRIEEANKKGIAPDLHYALRLLDETGIICVPGSGFGQRDGTYHIRLTNLVNPAEEMELMLMKLKEFTIRYFDKGYSIQW